MDSDRRPGRRSRQLRSSCPQVFERIGANARDLSHDERDPRPRRKHHENIFDARRRADRRRDRGRRRDAHVDAVVVFALPSGYGGHSDRADVRPILRDFLKRQSTGDRMKFNNPMAETFRAMLAEPGGIELPGCYDVLSAMILERAGFPAVFMSGYGIAASFLGNPDIGLTSLVETSL